MLKDVVNYEDMYEISDKGVVYSKERYVSHPVCGQKLINKKELFQAVENNRRRVTLYKNGKSKRFFVHRLVMQAFVGDCPKNMEVCHNDGNPANNSINNLRYDIRINNAADSKLHGTRLNGAKNHKTKLTKKDVIQIKTAQKNRTQESLAFEFGVSQVTISKIMLGKTWRHV